MLPPQATDAIGRSMEGRSAAELFGIGALLVVIGLASSFGVMRLFRRVVPRPDPPPPPPPLSAMPALGSPLTRVGAWLLLRLGHGPPASFRPALLAWTIFVWLAATYCAAMWLGIGAREPGDETGFDALELRRFALANVIVAGALLLFLAAWTQRLGGGLADVGLTIRHLGGALVLAVALYIVFVPVHLGALMLESGAWLLAGHETPHQAAVEAFSREKSAQRDLVVLVGFVVFTPIYEELLFRGVLQRFLGRLFNPGLGLFLATLLFALPHDAGWLSVFALGAALGWLMLRTGNLVAPIAFHMLHNGLTLLLIAWTGDSR